MTLYQLLDAIKADQFVSFSDVLTVIHDYYLYQPTAFSNGLAEDQLLNNPGTNEGSCKVFAFAKLHQLNQEQTLSLFGDYFWTDVLGNPEGTDHKNIRNFIKYGWDGIEFSGEVLTPK